MDVKATRLIYFSPTQTTQRILEGIARGVGAEAVQALDLTPPSARETVFPEIRDELVIFGAPVYGGRIPLDAVYRLRRLKGNGTPAVVVAVYGNRAYEDALVELWDLALACGFRPVAGGAFIGEHSFSTEATPIAHGRPDAEDLARAARFGEMVRQKLRDTGDLDQLPPPHVPGDRPYKARGEPWGISAATQAPLCTACGKCASVCPTAAVTVVDREVDRRGDVVETDVEACILCCACVKHCPTGARVMDHPRIARSVRWLSQNHGARREPEVYL